MQGQLRVWSAEAAESVEYKGQMKVQSEEGECGKARAG